MGKTLLLADDSVTIQKVVGISFASEDIAITTVDNGDDAISKARELRPDVILADVVMPGKSGYEVCEAVKADPNLQHIPVLLLTGTFEAFDETRASSAGAAGQVAKPFEAQTLVERVKDLLAKAPIAAPVEQAPPSPPPRPASNAGADNAFDFFDDPVGTETPAAAPAPEVERADFDLENPDAAFAFGTDELSESPAEGLEPPARGALPPAAHTVAILPEDLPPVGNAPAARSPLQPMPAEPPTMIPPPVPAPSATKPEGFDFEFEGAAAQSEGAAAQSEGAAAQSEGVAAQNPPPPEPEGAVSESTLLDPRGDSAFDVSSSELGNIDTTEPIPLDEPDAATQLIETPFPGAEAAPGSGPTMDLGDDPVMEMLAGDPVDSRSPRANSGFVEKLPTAAPSRSNRSNPIDFGLADEPVQVERTPWPEPPSTAVSEVPEAMPMEPPMPETDPEPALAMPVEPIEPIEPGRGDSAPFAAPVRTASLADDALEQIAPALQEQLHETLEKIAWEAFGQVTETVVEQAVERLEKIAWEVVPKLAETLIQEEIRKLKSE